MHACPTALRAAFVWWEIASTTEFEEKKFEDDVYDKTQSQFMNKSTNMESKEREIKKRSRKQPTKKRSST